MSRSRIRGLSRLAALCALLGAAFAQTTPVLSWLTEPSPQALAPGPDVVLTRDTGGRALQLVTDGRTPPAELARRYGVPPAHLTLLERRPGARTWQLALPAAVTERAPARPRSVLSYRVRPGDTMAGVAARFGLPLVDLLGMNLDRTSLDRLQPGSRLNIPTGPRGLLVRIKPGQSALSLIAGYGADLVQTARANDVLPTELQVGDDLLLPGIRATGFAQQLADRREAERRAALVAQRQAQYERFLAWKKAVSAPAWNPSTPPRPNMKSTSPGKTAPSGRPASRPTSARPSTRRRRPRPRPAPAPLRPSARWRPRPPRAPRRPAAAPWCGPCATTA
ncbi:LysM peptidoglycan-binding domain-containing protein [Deinococcus multiflagellatus]|uniref:LysM peptidoglycan-binding domain-containing protein n=1 Tax=Deinococcus multiflagellatus TaxID=1656887 RepID=A0ABW1ZFL9_9DEIO